MSKDKYLSFPKESIQKIEKLKIESDNLEILDTKVKDPNNPAKLIDIKLIKYIIS